MIPSGPRRPLRGCCRPVEFAVACIGVAVVCRGRSGSRRRNIGDHLADDAGSGEAVLRHLDQRDVGCIRSDKATAMLAATVDLPVPP